MSDSFPCNTNNVRACTEWPYELIAADLAAAIGEENARKACFIVGTYATRLGKSQMLSSLLVAFGDGLREQATAQPIAEHPRREPFVIKA